MLLLTLPTSSLFAIPAKQPLQDLYTTSRMTFFCEQPFSETGVLQPIAHQHQAALTEKVQWMPIVPLKQLARDYACYQQKCVNKKGKIFKGLRCCEQHDAQFQRMAKDLHNLVPETKQLKQQRARYRFAEFSHHSSTSHHCQLFIDKKHRRLEPPPSKRGIIARTYLYMKDTYSLTLTAEELALYWRWHQQYPVMPAERERNEKIFALQGRRNHYVQ